MSASQCQKRLWLEAYQGEAGEELSYSQQRRIEQGIYSLHDLPEDFPLTEKQAQAVQEGLYYVRDGVLVSISKKQNTSALINF